MSVHPRLPFWPGDLGREYEIAGSLGVTAADAYAAGLAGALCDDLTRQRLAAIGERHYAAV